MNKQQLIEQFLSKPIKVGDSVSIKGYGSQNKENWSSAEVAFIDDTYVYVPSSYDRGKKVAKEYCEKHFISEIKRSIRHIGANPFAKEMRVTTYQLDIESVLFRFGYITGTKDKFEITQRTEKYLNGQAKEITFNPFVVIDGVRKYYQRPLVWTLEDKQRLIDSIYNNVDIGKFITRERSFKWLENEIANGNVTDLGFKDAVDGKQRIHTILEFLQDKFPDSYGNYYSELSGFAHYKFLGYRNLSYGELDANSTDQDVLNVFLAINHAGVPMSTEHIEYVKSLRYG